MKFIDSYNANNGTIYLWQTSDGYPIESTIMQDVVIDSPARTSLSPSVVWANLVPKEEKLLMTVSTQKGCSIGGGPGKGCQFCDVAALPFKGNLDANEIVEQVTKMLSLEPHYTLTEKCFEKVKLGFARQGEPSHNLTNVLNTMKFLKKVYKDRINWLFCFNSVFPDKTVAGTGVDCLEQVLEFKEKVLNGFMHVQISANSTDEETRQNLFRHKVTPLEELIAKASTMPNSNRTITLNFILMEGVEVDPEKLVKWGATGDKFAIKLIPMNTTNESAKNELQSLADSRAYEVFLKLKADFEAKGLRVVTDTSSRIEQLSSICCGQLARKAIAEGSVFRNLC